MKKNMITLERILLALIMALAGFLSFFAVWNEGYSNTYYAAAVKSMLTGWNNFFFVSFDPGGFVSVDKPPFGLWIQALSAAIFGFHGWSLILPQAVAAVVSTALVYHLVRRSFENPASLVAALVFALTPVVAAVSRTNNLDAVLVMFLLLAAWAAIVASERGSLKLLVVSMALVGLGYNIKMLQAFGVLPAILLIYVLSPGNRTAKKIGHVMIAIVVLLIVSLSWTAIVELTPADQRPYVGGSQTNSALELAMGYNGIQRLLPGGSPAGMFPGSGGGSTTGGPPGNMPADGVPAIAGGGNATGMNMPGPGGPIPGGAGGFGGETGSAGLLRLFGEEMAGQISWLLPLAVLGFFSTLLILRKTTDGRSIAKKRSLYFWGMWMLPMLAYFSFAGFFHRYYLIMLAPSIAALCGIGVTVMWNEYRNRGPNSYLLPLSLVATTLVQCVFVIRYPELSYWLIPLVFAFALTSAAVLLFARADDSGVFTGIVKPLAVIGVAVLLVAPAAWSVTPMIYGSQSTLPFAGPELSHDGFMGGGYNGSAGPGMGFPGVGDTGITGLTDFLIEHRESERFLVAVPSSMTASGIILETGLPVMAVGGFGGGDPILTTDRLQQMVDAGEIRYYLAMEMPVFQAFAPPGNVSANKSAMPGMIGGHQEEISEWVQEQGTVVPASEWMGDRAVNLSEGTGFSGRTGGFTLYDLAGED